MPQMASITVKKDDGTTDVIYDAMAPSSGDKTAAVWSPGAVGGSLGTRPEVRMQSSSNAANTVRFVEGIVRWPMVQNVSGIDTVTGFGSFSFKLTCPNDAPDSQVNELVAQATNLLSSTLFRSAFQARFAPS